MKKIFFLLAVAAFSLTSCSKDTGLDDNSALSSSSSFEDNPNGGGGNNISASAVPAPVMSAFNARYADATQIQWKKMADGTYKAEFFRGAVKWQAIFTAAGALVKEEHK